jgi:hypothetical protein
MIFLQISTGGVLFEAAEFQPSPNLRALKEFP